jgi:beta-phosphoglucomutase-like phosphatase (HAD superfamily)
MEMNIRACIFDFDGILVNSEIVLVKTVGRAAGEYGFDFKDEDFFPCLGRTLEDIKNIQMAKFGPALSL